MAHNDCTNCGKSVNPTDKFCPACGHPVGGGAGRSTGRLNSHVVVLSILVLVALVYVVYHTVTPEEPVAGEGTQAHGRFTNQQEMQAFLDNLPTDYESLVSMGNALMDRKDYAAAVECYQRALEQNPGATDVRVDLGACQHALGLNDRAIANFTRALEDDPAHQVAKFNLGIVNYTLGNVHEAVEWWRKLLAENPPDDLKSRTEALIQQTEGQ